MKPQTGDEIVDALLAAGHRVRTEVDAHLRELGLSVARLKVLRLLADGPASMRQVSDALHIAPRSTTDLVDGLSTLGLVARTPHARDRRVTLLSLTAPGAARLEAGQRVAHEVHRQATREVPPARRAELVALLDGIGSAFEVLADAPRRRDLAHDR